MRDSIHIRNIRELFPYIDYSNNIRGKINCIALDYKRVDERFPSPIFLNAAISILVLSGTGLAVVNYERYPVKANSILLLSVSHLFKFEKCSKDFRCLCLLVGKEFMSEMDATDMIYKRIKYGVKLYNMPVISLMDSQVTLLLHRIGAVDKAIDDTGHLYQKEMILNSLFAFYLDLSNIIDSRSEFHHDCSPTRYESIIKSFIELLVAHYRQEHKVEFYASRLNISAHYLTLIVKRITGQSVCDFIFEMLYSEARNLLTHSRLSIQEITTILNFSDQSSFGKFFKRKAGISPADYRKKQD